MFCEGESEEAYISYIRSKYRVPIEIKTKISRTNINQNYVKRILYSVPKHKKDKLFLLYDIDRQEMLERLQSIKYAILLVSNPCIELWFVLHTCNHTAEATADQILNKLERICDSYKKGSICDKLKHELDTGVEAASKRAKKLVKFNNPSTTVYFLLDEISQV